MRNKYIYITLLSALVLANEAGAQTVPQAPKLVVSITVDELRTDHLETFAPLYNAYGLRRMLTEGAFYTNASYSFTPVDRASAAASLSTGTTPYYHGVTGEEWLDRSTLRPVRAVLDQRQGYSPRQLGTSTVGNSGMALDDKTDLLSIGYSVAPQMEGYVALDRTIAQLVDSVSKRVPLDRVLFVLTSTGSARVENEQNNNEKFRIPTGKFDIQRTANLLNMYLGATFGTAQYVESIYRNQLFLDHKLLERKNINMGDLLRRAQEFILQLSGVRHVYTANQLTTSDSNQLERIRNGFNVEKCGDLLIDIAPGWELVNEHNHTSTTSRASNIPFPIIFFGAGVQAQRVQTPVTADAIAPTIARIIRIRAPNACSAEPLF